MSTTLRFSGTRTGPRSMTWSGWRMTPGVRTRSGFAINHKTYCSRPTKYPGRTVESRFRQYELREIVARFMGLPPPCCHHKLEVSPGCLFRQNHVLLSISQMICSGSGMTQLILCRTDSSCTRRQIWRGVGGRQGLYRLDSKNHGTK